MSPCRNLLQRISWVAACAMFSLQANAGPLEEWAEQWKAGTAFAEHPHYQQVYDETYDRDIRFVKQVREGDIALALYEAKLTSIFTDRNTVEKGLVAFYLEGEKPRYVEFALLDGRHFDQAMAGQVADVATTAAGLAAGLTEANPAMAGLAGGPGGLVAMLALKLGATKAADRAALPNCIAARQVSSGVGWGAAAWNIGMMAGAPALGLIGAIVTASRTTDRATALRSCLTQKLAKAT